MFVDDLMALAPFQNPAHGQHRHRVFRTDPGGDRIEVAFQAGPLLERQGTMARWSS